LTAKPKKRPQQLGVDGVENDQPEDGGNRRTEQKVAEPYAHDETISI